MKKRGMPKNFSKEEIKRIIEEDNKILIEKYPFVAYKNTNYTFLDDIPDGWRFAFGELFLKELSEALAISKRWDDNIEYSVIQAKEKFGEFRWYDFGSSSETEKVVNLYQMASCGICIYCGKTGVPVLSDWGYISPACKECYEEIVDNYKKETEKAGMKPYKRPTYDECVRGEFSDSVEVVIYKNGKSNEIIHNLKPVYEKIDEYRKNYEDWVASVSEDKRKYAEELMNNCILFDHAKEVIKKM